MWLGHIQPILYPIPPNMITLKLMVEQYTQYTETDTHVARSMNASHKAHTQHLAKSCVLCYESVHGHGIRSHLSQFILRIVLCFCVSVFLFTSIHGRLNLCTWFAGYGSHKMYFMTHGTKRVGLCLVGSIRSPVNFHLCKRRHMSSKSFDTSC